MKKAMLTVTSNLVCIGLVGLIAITSLLMHQSVFAMSSTVGNTTSANELKNKSKIVITEKKGYLYDKKANGEFTLQENAEKVAYKIGSLSLDEMEKKLKSDDYLERVLAYFYYRVKTNHKIDVELCHENEEGWDAVIEKMIVDLKWASNREAYYNYEEASLEIILEGLKIKLVEYFEKNPIQKYEDENIRKTILIILANIAQKQKELIPRIIELINPLRNDDEKHINRAAEKITEKLIILQKEK